MKNNYTLTPEQWAQIPVGYDFYAIDHNGKRFVYSDEPTNKSFPACWALVTGYCIELPRLNNSCPEWESTLQQRPTTNDQPEAAPTLPVSHVRLPLAEFERIAADFGLNVRNCGTYCDAAMYNPAGQIAIVFVADVPVNVTVHDEVNGIPVTVHDQI